MKHGQLPFNVDASTRAVARGLGQLPKVQILRLAKGKYLLVGAHAHERHGPRMWLSLKKRAKGWQGRLEGFKNSHGPSKMRKLPNK